jgi:hypothetical protein
MQVRGSLMPSNEVQSVLKCKDVFTVCVSPW